MNQNQPNTLTPDYFKAVYAASTDPWNFAASPYEQAKYAASLAALPRPHYGRALEIGCSIGVFTALLAGRCGQLLGVDVSAEALAQAAARCAALPQVAFQQRTLPAQFPAQPFDLITLCEVGYYWNPADLARAARRIEQALPPGGQLLLVHWLPAVHDYPLTGDEVHNHFLGRTRGSGALRHLAGHRAEKYRIDVFEKRGWWDRAVGFWR